MKISFKNHLRDRFLTILAWFWGPLASPETPKINKKASRKNSKIYEAQKTLKNLEKGIKPFGPAECADRGEDYGGGRRHAKTGKIWKKWKTEIEAKDGEKNLEDPARRLARRPEGRRIASRIPPGREIWSWEMTWMFGIFGIFWMLRMFRMFWMFLII